MLILLVTSMSAVGGTERSTQTLSELLIARGHEVHLLGTKGPLCEDIQKRGVKFFEAETHSTSPLANLKLLGRLTELLKTYSYDCVHAQMARPVPIVRLAKVLAKAADTKIIWHSRGINASTYRYVPRLFSWMGVRAIGNCKDEQEKLVRYGFRRDRVGFSYNPSRLEHKQGDRSSFRAKYGFKDDDVVIGSLSRLDPERGVHYALDYFDALCKTHLELGQVFLVIGGDGRDRAMLEAMAAKTMHPERVLFLGAIKAVENFYAGIDLFWNPVAFIGDQSAGTGNTLIEAGFQRVPMVSHRWGGVEEIVVNGVTGGLADIGGKEDFVAYTVRLLTDEPFRKENIDRAFERVSALVGSAECIARVEKYYLEL